MAACCTTSMRPPSASPKFGRRHLSTPYLTGEVAESPRNAIVYFSDDGELIAVRVGDWKFNLAVQRADTMRQWAEPFVKLRLPYIISLRRDPFERAEFNSNTYLDWMVDHVPQLYQMQAVVASQLADFVKFPRARNPPRSTWTRCWSK